MRSTLLAAFTAICGVTVSAAPMTKIEREHLVAHMQMTQSWLVDEVSNLSPAQLNFHS